MTAANQYPPGNAVVQPQDIRWTWQETHIASVKREPDQSQNSPSICSPDNLVWNRGQDGSSNSIVSSQSSGLYTHNLINRPPPVFINGMPSPYSDLFTGSSTSFDCISPAQTHLNQNNNIHCTTNNTYMSPQTEEFSQNNESSIIEAGWDHQPYTSESFDLHYQQRQHSHHIQATETSDWSDIQRMPKYKSASPVIATKPVTLSSSMRPSSSVPPRPKTLRRSRTESTANERNTRSWKAAHNLVERNYRDRLNDQIAELSNVLFESPKGSKPPKSLVISRAKERIRELAFQNEKLAEQVDKLRQHIAVLDHVARVNSGCGSAGGGGGSGSEMDG